MLSALLGTFDPASGGGVSVDRSGSIEIINCTIANNESDSVGGGYAQFSTETDDAVILNTIIWGNTAGSSGPEIFLDSAGGDVLVEYSDVRDRNGSGVDGSVTWGSGNIGENTSTHDPDFYDLNDYRITCPSPCKDAADGGLVPADDFDIDGDSVTAELTPDRDQTRREIEGEVDMGCYELESESL